MTDNQGELPKGTLTDEAREILHRQREKSVNNIILGKKSKFLTAAQREKKKIEKIIKEELGS